MIADSMPDIDEALAEESWTWLQDNAPMLASAIAKEAARKRTPEQVYRYIMKRVGSHREALAWRARLAVQHIQAQDNN